jgi:hypothetical protein
MAAAVAASLRERTGRSLDEWLAEVERGRPDPLDQRAVRAWLRDEHRVPQNSQWAIATAAAERAGWVRPDVEGYIDAQYSGAKAGLRFERPPRSPLLAAAKSGLGQSTHRVGLASVEEVSADVASLLREAYEQNGP